MLQTGQRMGLGHGKDDPVLTELQKGIIRLPGFPVLNALDQIRVFSLAVQPEFIFHPYGAQLKLLMLRDKLSPQTEKQTAVLPHAGAEHNTVLLFKTHIFNVVLDLMAFLYQKTAFFGKIAADRRQADSVGGPVKQSGADVRFQTSDLLCHSAAGNKELFPGLGKTAAFRDGEEGFNLLQLQKRHLFWFKGFPWNHINIIALPFQLDL